MKKFQKNRISLRNTLKLKKYGFPLFFMMNIMSVILIVVMVKYWR